MGTQLVTPRMRYVAGLVSLEPTRATDNTLVGRRQRTRAEVPERYRLAQLTSLPAWIVMH